jgi:hypothetical protein
VGLAGPSGGAMFVLDAAARSEAVSAAAVCDPLAFELLTVEDGCDSMMRWGEWRSPPGEGELEEPARDRMTEWANAEK